MAERILTITQLNEYVEGALKHDPVLRSVRLRGEVSNFSRHFSGNVFFTLKDEFSLIRCALFANMGGAAALRDGANVLVKGYVSLYAKTGQYQFYVQEIQDDGIGELFIRFEKLKAELDRLGYFSAERKRAIPFLPRRIGIVTSPTGAVLHDIERVAHRRFAPARLLLSPARVQGEGAAEEIARAIERLNAVDEVDVIIIGRGGGAIEDLWAFNERIVADAIFRSAVPVISAVGHETDFTIADFVADLRAPTPSAAAELAVANRSEIAGAITSANTRMQRAINQMIKTESSRMMLFKKALFYQHPSRRIADYHLKLNHLSVLLSAAAKKELFAKRALLQNAMDKLDSLSPLSSLSRGYAMVFKDERIVPSIHQLQSGDVVTIAFRDGTAAAKIESIDSSSRKGLKD